MESSASSGLEAAIPTAKREQIFHLHRVVDARMCVSNVDLAEVQAGVICSDASA